MFICVHLWFHFCLPMANIAIDAHVSSAVAVDAPSHGLIYFATDAMHLSNLAVTSSAFETGSNVRLVRGGKVCLRFMPIHPAPRRLVFSFGELGQLLHLRT